MHMIAYVRLLNLYSIELKLELGEGPCFLAREKRVLEANSLARALGIVPGMGVAEAKMLTQGRGCIPFREEDFFEPQRRWLDECAQLTDVIEPEDLHSAFLDLSRHPNPIDLLAKLQENLKSKGWNSQAGMAGCRWIAKVASYVDRHECSPLLTPRRYIAPLGAEMLPIPPEHIRRLNFLGYKTIGEIDRLDLEVLRKQFGNEAIEIKRHASGGGNPVVLALYPPNSITESFRYDGAPDTLEGFEMGLKLAAEKLAGHLVEEDLFGERLDLFLEHEKGDVSHCGRTFSKPYHTPETVWSNLKLIVPKAEITEVCNIRLRASELKKLKRVQMEFEIGSRKANSMEKASRAIHHVHKVFGTDAVKLGSQLSEARRQKVLKAWRSANGWR